MICYIPPPTIQTSTSSLSLSIVLGSNASSTASFTSASCLGAAAAKVRICEAVVANGICLALASLPYPPNLAEAEAPIRRPLCALCSRTREALSREPASMLRRMAVDILILPSTWRLWIEELDKFLYRQEAGTLSINRTDNGWRNVSDE